MKNCMFPCFPRFQDLGFGGRDSDGDDEEHSRRRRKNRVNNLQMANGKLTIPMYRKVRREGCPLLQLAWEQRWKELLVHCMDHPEQALQVTQHSGRTALHLATFSGHTCPLKVAMALLEANRHQVLVQDNNWYTPLHNACFFAGESLVSLFCDTCIMVEQELGDGGEGLPPLSGTSPLFLASKRAAPLATLRTLLKTRSRTQWIAPSTGGEPYWMESLDEYSSPLEILFRDRGADVFSHVAERPHLRAAMKQVVYKRLQGDDFSLNDDDGTTTVIETTNMSRMDSATKKTTTRASLDLTDPRDVEALALWEKCIELLAEFIPRIEGKDGRGFGIVHAIASCKVPIPLLLQVALQVFPEQALQQSQDNQGRLLLPLYHVLLAKHPHATVRLVQILLDHEPQAVLRNRLSDESGPTPLALALELGYVWEDANDVISLLLAAESDSTLSMVDPRTGLYPFQVAAMKNYDVNVIYSLLVQHPQVLAHYSSSRT